MRYNQSVTSNTEKSVIKTDGIPTKPKTLSRQVTKASLRQSGSPVVLYPWLVSFFGLLDQIALQLGRNYFKCQ